MSGWSPHPLSRRAVLATGAISIGTIAGCSALSSESPMLDVTLFNDVDSPYSVEMGLFRVNGDLSQSEARAYSESIDVEPEGEARREDIAEIRQYLIRYDVYEDNSRRTDKDHVHYYPPGDGVDDTVTFDIHPPGVMTRRHG